MPTIDKPITDLQRLDLAWLNVIDMESRTIWTGGKYVYPEHLRRKAWADLYALRAELGLIPGGKNVDPA